MDFAVRREGDPPPLLADVDGDGRDDLCVPRSGSLLCDTAHDGGAAETKTSPFGLPGDVPLAGDLDGDGRDDACVRRGNRVLCDSKHDGGGPDLVRAFGRPGEPALLGDPDGDGFDDVCVVRDRRFLCDTGGDGGAAEWVLSLREELPAGEWTPLLGDDDGDGRDEACLAGGGRLICFARDPQGRPSRRLDRSWGEPGDVPLLGDVDAF
jgi:hypothetical protein